MRRRAKTCSECGGRLSRDLLTGILVCNGCGVGWTGSGKKICKECLGGDCSRCVKWHDRECHHECFLQAYYGSPEDIGYITPTDW